MLSRKTRLDMTEYSYRGVVNTTGSIKLISRGVQVVKGFKIQNLLSKYNTSPNQYTKLDVRLTIRNLIKQKNNIQYQRTVLIIVAWS